MALEWMPGAMLGVAGAALAWWRAAGISEAKFQERLQQLKEEMQRGLKLSDQSDTEFKVDLCAAINELRAVTLTIAKLSSGQDVINSVTTKTLESLVRQMEDNKKDINELKGTMSLLRQILDQLPKVLAK